MLCDLQSRHELPTGACASEITAGLGLCPERPGVALDERHREAKRIIEALVRDYYCVARRPTAPTARGQASIGPRAARSRSRTTGRRLRPGEEWIWPTAFFVPSRVDMA